MSEVHVHGVTHAAERAAIEEAGARAVVHGELAAVVGDAAPDTRAADLARRHWKVLEAIAATATVLPVRFGTVMAGVVGALIGSIGRSLGACIHQSDIIFDSPITLDLDP